VLKAENGSGASRHIFQSAKFENLDSTLEFWFSGVRFKEGEYYQLIMIPDTKYILDYSLIKNYEK
jgi:hypothetical protein